MIMWRLELEQKYGTFPMFNLELASERTVFWVKM